MLGTAASPRPQTSGVRQARGADWVAACVKGGGFVPSSFWKLFIMGGKKKEESTGKWTAEIGRIPLSGMLPT